MLQVHGSGEVLQPGRHVARQHVPGVRVRRAQSPLQLQLLPQPRLVQELQQAEGDPGVPPEGRRQVGNRPDM